MTWWVSTDHDWMPAPAPEFVVGIQHVDEMVHEHAVDFILGNDRIAHARSVRLGMSAETHPKASEYQYGS